MFRPPAREVTLNTLEDVYRTCKPPLYSSWSMSNRITDEDSRPAAGKILARWRPQSVEGHGQPEQSSPVPPEKNPNTLPNGSNPPESAVSTEA